MQRYEESAEKNSRSGNTSVSSAPLDLTARFDESLDELSLQADLAALNDDEVAQVLFHRYRPTYLNLFSLFRNNVPSEELHRIAAHITKEATWSYAAAERLLLRFPEHPFSLSHAGWDRQVISQLLDRGKGLIICSFRFGMYSLLPPDLGLLGLPVTCPVADTGARLTEMARTELRHRLATDCTAKEDEKQKAQNLLAIRLLEVKSRATSLSLAKALRRQSVVFIYADGNNGVTGGWGDDGRQPVTFFGSPAYVKTGVARLSLMCGTPILPVISIKTGAASGKVHLLDPIIPESSHSDASAQSFTGSVMQQLYGYLQQYATQYPNQWEGISALHRWRHCMDAQVTAQSNERKDDVSAAIHKGATFRINKSGGVTALPGDEHVWVNTEQMRMVRIPQSARHLASALVSGSGVNLNWIQSQDSTLCSTILSHLGDLYCRQLIASS